MPPPPTVQPLHLPPALLDYLATSPLPVVGFSHPIGLNDQNWSNPAAKALWGGGELSSCLELVDRDRLQAWLESGDKEMRSGCDEIELDLSVLEGTSGEQGGSSRRVLWRASRTKAYTILTGIGVSASAPSPPSLSPRADSDDGTLPYFLGDEKSPTSPLRFDSVSEVAGIADRAPVGLWRSDLAIRLQWVNRFWWEITGGDPGQPNDWVERVHLDDQPRMHEFSAKLTRERKPTEIEFRWKTHDGVERWCLAVVAIERGPDGEPVGFLGSLQNISRHKTTEFALQAASKLRLAEAELAIQRELRIEERTLELALLSKFAAVGMVRIALDGTFLWVNEAWYDIVKHSRDEDLNEWYHLIHEDDVERYMSTWKECLKTLKPLEIQYRWKNGDVCLYQAVPNNPIHQNATGWIGTITDYSLQAKAEKHVLDLSHERELHARQAAEEAEARQAHAEEQKRQQELLVDVTSHEIRNPISAILQNAQLTRDSLTNLTSSLTALAQLGHVPAEFAETTIAALSEDIEALDSISECGRVQERIANDILGLAQIQLQRYTIAPIPFDLIASIRHTLKMFTTEARSKGIELRLATGSSLSRLGPNVRVHADPARLAQIIINLLSNAIRFTSTSPVRRVTLSIEVSAMAPGVEDDIVPPHETEHRIEERTPVYLFFSIADTGPGMLEEEVSRLFNRFMQASPLTHTTMGGSGLGLWVCRNLCELQGGRIEVKSKVGEGSVFRCFITAESVDAGDAAGPDSSNSPTIEGLTPGSHLGTLAPTPSASSSVLLPQTNRVVLCCEDNEINRKILRRQLASTGYTVLFAHDGEEGIAAFKKASPAIDCIVMDFEMPVVDGLAATRAIRAVEAARGGKRVRIVGLTGSARAEQLDAGTEAGMDVVLTKPYKVAELLDFLSEPK